MKKIGILYHPELGPALPLARELSERLRAMSAPTWLCSAWEEEKARGQAVGSDLIISIGGDGTILHAAHIVTPWPIPILGVNLGRLGFMTECSASEVRERLGEALAGQGWIDERAMLQVDLQPRGKAAPASYHALNDAVVGRGALARTVELAVSIDGLPLTTYKADGTILASATGSTGYSLAAGGPILHPQSKDMVLKPLLPHLAPDHALVLPSASQVEVEVRTSHQAMLSVDGQVNQPLESGDRVRVKLSPHVIRFLRFQDQGCYYRTLAQRLARR